MRKKLKFQPGSQYLKHQQDLQTREKAALMLREYYEKQEILNKILEAEKEATKLREPEIEEEQVIEQPQENLAEEKHTTQPLKTEEKPIKNTQAAQQLPVYNSYKTQSALDYLNGIKDETAFQDAIAPSILEYDKYMKWAMRQSARSINNPSDPSDTATTIADAAVGMHANFVLDDLKKKERVSLRYARRLWEHDTFGKLNKNKALTNNEVKEIVDYQSLTDPQYLDNRIGLLHDQLEQQEKEELEELSKVNRPADYYGDTNYAKPAYMPNSAGGDLSAWMYNFGASKWGRSAMSDFILRTNESQMKVTAGQILRSKEFTDMAAGVSGVMDDIDRYVKNLASIERYNSVIKSMGGFQNADPQTREIYNALIQDNHDIQQRLQSNDWWKTANNLASWAPTTLGYAFGMVDKVVDDDIGGVRNGLYGLDSKLDNLRKQLNENTHDDKWYYNISKSTDEIRNQLKSFNEGVSKRQEKWREQFLTDAQDIVDWKSGDNWLNFKAEVDPYYKAQKTLLEKSNFDWSDPVKMAMFGWSGVAGGSNSSWWKSIIGGAAKIVGAGAAFGTGGTSALTQLGAIGVSFEAEKSAGSDENNIEVSDKVSQRLTTQLQSSGQYDEFLKEGIQQLLNKGVKLPGGGKLFTENGREDIPVLVRQYESNVLKKSAQNKDKEELRDFVMDAYISGLWLSKNPQITKMHADAIIGANNQFYNDQPVNTADAAIGSIVDIATLNTAKYLARATKIGIESAAVRFGIKYGNTPPVRAFKGFRNGLHNSAVKAIESSIITPSKELATKTLGAASKVPLGVYVGASLGFDAGYAASDGSIYGGIAGAVAGGATAYGLGKGLKWIGVEDKIANAYQKVRSFGTRLPGAWLKAAAVGKGVGNISGRVALDTASEMWQEGVQALNARDDFDYDTQANRPMLLRVFDDMLLGSRAAYIWLNQNDPEMIGEADVYSQMNATPLLTLIGPNTPQVFVQMHRTFSDYKLASAIANNIDAERRGNVQELEQNRLYAKHASKDQRRAILLKFDLYKKIAGIHDDAQQKLDPHELLSNDKHHIPTEIIDEQRKDYEDVYEYIHSRDGNSLISKVNAIRKLKGKKPIQIGSDDFAKLVSYEMFARRRRAEKWEAFYEASAAQAALLGESAVSELIDESTMQEAAYRDELLSEKKSVLEIEEQQRKKYQTPFDIAKDLVRALTLFRIVNDYSTLQKISGKEDVFLSRSKSHLQQIKETLKNNGIKIENEDDVMRELNNSEEGAFLDSMMRRAAKKNAALNGIEYEDSQLSFADLIDSYDAMLRERELLEFDAILADQQLESFEMDPDAVLNQWQDRAESDEKLERMIEEDYVGRIQDYEKAQNRSVKDGDVYRGYDGEWYIVKGVDGNFKKHYWDWKTGEIGRRGMYFDRVEFDKWKTSEETRLRETKGRSLANQNIQQGEVKSESTTEERTILQPSVEPAPENSVEMGLLFQPDEEVAAEYEPIEPGAFVRTIDSETGEERSAIVVETINDENENPSEVRVSYPGKGVVNVPIQNVYRIDTPISPSKHKPEEILTSKLGKQYTVADVQIASIDDETNEPTYSYTILDMDTNEPISNVSDQDIENILDDEIEQPEEVSEPFERSDEQVKAKKELEYKLEKQKKEVGDRKPTPHDYFIKVKNKITKFIRVHGILDPLFDQSQDEIDDYNKYLDELKSLYDKEEQTGNKDAQTEFKTRVLQLQKEFNDKLEQKFGLDSAEYKQYSIDLSSYINTSVIKDDSVVYAIASILSSLETNPALIVGTHIDSIARDFFNNKGIVENKPEYNMTPETFKSIINQLNQLKKRFEELKWDVYTDDFIWYGQTGEGVRFAGATDMVAIDQQGRIHILDFKTTRSPLRFEKQIQYKGEILDVNDEDVVANYGWVTVTDEDQIPEGAERRVTSRFLSEIATKDYGQTTGRRTYALQYARQLTAYRHLIQAETGREVASMEIIPFYVDYTVEDEKVTSINDIKVYDTVDLSQEESLREDIDGVENFLNTRNTTRVKDDIIHTIEQSKNTLAELQSRIAEKYKHLSNKNAISVAKAEADVLKDIETLLQILSNPALLSDDVYISQAKDNLNSSIQKYEKVIQEAEDSIEPEEIIGEGEDNGPDEGEKRNWFTEKIEDVVDSARQFWWQFNNLHSWSEAVTKMPKWAESIIKTDFIKNSTFVIKRVDNMSKLPWRKGKDNPKDNVFEVVVTYRGHKFDPIRIRLGNEATDPKARNYDSQGDNFDAYSIMGRNLIKQFYQLTEMFPGKTIIATKVDRTNGTLVFAKEEKHLEETAFLSKDDPRYGSMLDGDNSIIGVVDEVGNIVEITDGKRHPLWSPEYDDAGLKHPKKRLQNVPGNDTDYIAPGTVMFLYKFKNDEDPEDAPVRIVPIALKGFKLCSEKGTPSSTAKALVSILQHVATGGRLSTQPKVTAVMKDGSTKKIQIPGFTRRKALSLFTRFGQQASFAGHEFVLDFARDDNNEIIDDNKVIEVTDMRQAAVRDEASGELHRPTILLRLDSQNDIDALYEILSHVDFHINQFGKMRHELNKFSDESPFGDLRKVFADEENQDVVSLKITDELVIDKEDVEKGLTGIEWCVKHGLARTNAIGIENPLISIHELGVEGETIPEDPVANTVSPVEVEEGPQSSEVIETAPTEPTEPEEKKPRERKKGGSKKRKNKISISDILAAGAGDSNLEDVADSVQFSTEDRNLRRTRLTKKLKDKVEKNIRRLVGNIPVIWSDHVLEILKSGANVVGRAAIDAFELYDKMPEGTEYHETFHRIFEILLPNSIRESLYDDYYRKHNEEFKKENGRDLEDTDISEAYAEMFRHFMIDREHIQFGDLSKTWGELKQMIDALKALNSRKVAFMFLLANSGVFRFKKPNAKNVQHFLSALAGKANLTIKANIKGLKLSAELTEFPEIGGKDFLNDAVMCIVYALTTSYSISYMAQNASRLKTDLKAVQSLNKGKETTEHSAWFRVITGEYANEDDEMTIEDAKMYYTLYAYTDEMQELKDDVIDSLPEDADAKTIYANIINEILETEGTLAKDELDQKQKMLALLFSPEVWPIVETKVNRRLSKMGIDSELITYEQQVQAFETLDGKPDNTEPGNGTISTDVSDHSDYFFDHSRTEDATAAIRFFLSSIPDEHFATQDDIDDGVTDSLTNSKGEPIMVKNRSSLFGFKTFLSMKTVSQRLLSECHDVRTAEELDQLLQDLSSQDPIFWRIARKYHGAKEGEIIKWKKSKKNVIYIDGIEANEDEYAQHRDENGFYYTWVEDGKDTGNRITNAVTQVDPDKESFVTQLFNFVACQRLDFIRVKLEQKIDDYGDPLEGQYEASVLKTSDDYAATVFPRQWFVRLRSGITGIFKMTPEGEYEYTKEGEKILNNAVSVIHNVYNTIRNARDVVEINGKKYNKAKESDVLALENMYISALNDLGIDISREAFEYALHKKYGNGRKISLCLLDFFGEANANGLSYKTFLQKIDLLKENAVKKGGQILSKNLPEIKEQKRGKWSRPGQNPSGQNIYSENSVIKWFASATSAYNKSTKELMTNGPDNTKRYLMAQSHTAADITQDINVGVADTKQPMNKREIKNSKVLRDMAGYIYNIIRDGVHSAIPIGSIIIKHVLDNGKINLELHTHGGIMVNDDKSGGKSYSDITRREDWLAKYAILKDGGIIFPTLSDKSTWFYLTGVRVPGLNYKNLKSISNKDLLNVGLIKGQLADSTEVHISFDGANEQIDQMIEYAECEMRAIEREINRKTPFPFIKFFDENKRRFSGLVEICKIGDDGKKELVLLNDYDQTPEDCLALAKREFFDLPKEEKRRRMALTLEEGFYENIDMLERAGLIITNDDSTRLYEDVLDKNGKPTGEKRAQNMLLQFQNVGLDDTVISRLRDAYMEKLKIDKTDAKGIQRCTSLAICQNVWDIYMRGVISEEEVERMYIGQPQFFQWAHEKIFDARSKRNLHCLVDRHKDQSKRLGGLGSTGEKNRLDLADVRRSYVCAEIKDTEVQSELYEDYKRIVETSAVQEAYVDYKSEQIKNDDKLTDEEKREKLNALSDSVYKDELDIKEMEKELDENAGIALERARKSANDALASLDFTKPADGAAFISPKMTKTLLRMRGKFTGQVKEAFLYLEGKSLEGESINPLRVATAYKVVTDALIGTLKYSAYGYRINASTEEIPIHYYDKFALFPLFKFMATGFTSDLLRKMEQPGAEIDMVMMASGVKTGSQEASTFEQSMFKNEDGTFNEQAFEDFQFSTYEQDYAFIRRQLNTEPHEKDTTTMGTQMTKVALANLKPNYEYRRYIGRISDEDVRNSYDNERYEIVGEDVYEHVRGYEVLQDIMDSIKELSNLGEALIRKEIFNEDGTLDMDAFSDFLQRELDSRDADANLIDGVEVIEVETDEIDPETGKRKKEKRFNVELEAMSSVDWLQSILVSKINKETCDINVKGNAFYQRPDWGVEGKPIILDDESVDFAKRGINGGQRLNEINNDGSMDAVISIDFFYDILPEGIRDNFEKSRAWLIKHKIIGNTEDVHACCINARIPTQAQSSIGALRFVDVLPVVRDTIILPSAITGIDGSDFDIDKRYLVRLSYNIKYGKNGEEDIVSTEFDKDKNPTDYHRNKLIRNYITVLQAGGIFKETGRIDPKTGKREGKLKSGPTSHISLYSIDKDTKLVTNVRDIINRARPRQRYYAYMFGNIAFQVATKIKFMIGKFGIGPFALNNNNHILTMLYNVNFKGWGLDDKHSILEQLGLLSLSGSEDKQGNRIMSWLSGLINVHVDIAKNPDSIDGLNINTFTYNLVNLLIRTGMGERALFFTAQPIMEELARVYDDASGSFLTDPNVSKSRAQRDAINQFLFDNFAKEKGSSASTRKGMEDKIKRFMLNPYVLSEEGMKNQEDIIGSFAKALFGIGEDGKYTNEFLYFNTSDEPEIRKGCILEDILTNPEVRKNVNKGVSFDNMEDQRVMYRIKAKDDSGNVITVDLTPKQVQEYVAYIQNCLNIYGEQLSNLVNACKIDTKKHGKNFIEQQAYLDKFKEVFEDNQFFEEDGLKRLKDESYVGVKTENATKLYKDIMSQISMQATDSFIEIHDRILKRLNSSRQNKQLANKVTRAIMSEIKQDFFDQYMQEQGEDYYENLLYGKDNIQNRLIKLQNKIKSTKHKYRKYGTGGIITNPLLRSLQADIYEERKNFDDPAFITMEDALLDDGDTSSMLERAWDDMYNDEDPEIKQFAIDLAVYAFITSGDQSSGGSFFKFVPNTIRKGLTINRGGKLLNYSDFIYNTRKLFREGLDDDTIESLVYNTILSNWYDDDFVTKVPTHKTYGKRKYRNLTQLSWYKDKSTSRVRKKSKQGKIYYVTETTSKKIITEIAGVRKTQKGNVETIRKNGDEYPLFIKVRRPRSDRFDNDNTILYEYIGSKPLDEENPDKGTYPIYRIVHPNTGRFRAGSYYYKILGIYNSDKTPIYPYSVSDVLNTLQHDESITTSTGDDMLNQIAEALNDMSVGMDDEQLEEFLRKEAFLRDMDFTDKEIKKKVRKLSDLVEPEEKDEVEVAPKYKIEKEKDGSIDIWYGSDPKTRKNGQLSNLAKRPVKYKGYEYPSVEAAFLAQKLEYSSMDEESKEEIRELLRLSVGTEATNIGRKIDELDVTEWDKNKKSIIEDIMRESFEQNEKDMNLLLSTGDAKLTHKKAKKPWSETFPEILTKLREEFKSKHKLKKTSKTKGSGVVTKIISGGQTGVDTIGLQVGKRLGIETGGTAPKGFKREEGIDTEDISSYGLVEITDSEQSDYTNRTGKTDAYTGRTDLNVKNSDGTVYFNFSGDKSGMMATQRSANEHNKPFIVNPTAEELKKWIKDNGISVLNVAGNRGSKMNTELLNKVISTLEAALKSKEAEPKSTKKDVISIEKDYPQFKTTAVRPFTYNGILFLTAHQAYNYFIVDAFDIDEKDKNEYKQSILDTTDATAIKAIVSEAQALAEDPKPLTKDEMIDLRLRMAKESFKQNPEALKELMDTVGTPFDDTSAGKAMTIVRSELIAEQLEEAEFDDSDQDDEAMKTC